MLENIMRAPSSSQHTPSNPSEVSKASEASEQFCVVMPIIRCSYLLSSGSNSAQKRTREHDNFERFFRVGMPTFHEHLVWDDVHRFYVIVPHKEVASFKRLLQEHVPQPHIADKFECIEEEKVLALGSAPTKLPSKTRTQMLCKILIAAHIPTPHYLIVDDDVVLCRRFGLPQLFADKKRKFLKFTPDQARHDNWWKGSAEVLGMDPNKAIGKVNALYRTNWVINVTPEVFSTTVAKQLMSALEARHGSAWVSVIGSMDAQTRWTEYTLYWLFLLDTNQLKSVYRGSRIRPSDGATSIWYRTSDLVEAVRRMRQNKRQYFGVIQSNVAAHTVEAVEAAWKASGDFHM